MREILATRELTFYRASQRSAEMFGRFSPFYLPHNLHSDLAVSSATPTLYQLMALSRITRYRISVLLASCNPKRLPDENPTSLGRSAP
ncbi:MAG: hypothetical protein WA197_14785 [Candidatus Acidiferrales bacterium]